MASVCQTHLFPQAFVQIPSRLCTHSKKPSNPPFPVAGLERFDLFDTHGMLFLHQRRVTALVDLHPSCCLRDTEKPFLGTPCIDPPSNDPFGSVVDELRQ